MTHTIYKIAGRIFSSIKRWLRSRMQECIRCSECENAVSPWASHCPTCGQANPARVSATAGVYLALGIVLLTVILSSLTIVF